MLFNLKVNNIKRTLFFIFMDIILSSLTLYLAYLLRFNFHIPSNYYTSFYQLLLLTTLSKLAFLALFKTYNFTWRFFGLYEVKKITIALIAAYGFIALIVYLFYDFFTPFPRSALIIDFFLSLLFLNAIRALKRILNSYRHNSSLKKAVIYGANPKTKGLIEDSLNGGLDYEIVGVIDKDKDGYISGIPIVKELNKKVDALIFTQKVSAKELNQLIQTYKKIGIKEFKNAFLTQNEIVDIDIEDLLAREPKDLDIQRIKEFIKDKKVLITGAGGSIGSELVKQCNEFGAKEIVAVENSEYALYNLKERFNDIKAHLCDVKDFNEIDEIIKKYSPDIILHAAAYKHVPLAEENPKATIKTNILGTKNVVDSAIKNKIEHFILISTDKAVNPTNIMGATKRVCELYIQNVNSNKTTISAVRFGNVLGSSGSVIPKFKQQILSGGPITITHPDIKRFFMLISEACQLVLQAGSLAKDREIFILDMGEPVKIVDLAKNMMTLYNKEVPIKFIGLRPGEKLYEEILIEGAEEKTKYKSIYIAKPTTYDIEKLNKDIDQLLKATNKKDIISLLKKIVKEFNHQPNK